jgi:hypothetical protein
MRLKNIMLLGGIVAAVAWYLNRMAPPDSSVFEADPEHSFSARPIANFRCEGKTHCSEMSSCTEATFYLKNCPGTQMDGDGDGVPCESQHCDR